MVDAALHLPSLSIQNFRGISDLTIERLGRVTLIVGENGVGKTTLLDAVRLYATQGYYPTLRKILLDNDEVILVQNDETAVAIPDFAALFYGRQPSSTDFMTITPNGVASALTIKPGGGLFRRNWSSYEADQNDNHIMLSISLSNHSGEVRITPHSEPGLVSYRQFGSKDTLPEIPFITLGPNVPDNADIARFWSEVALTPAETRALDALRLIYGAAVEQVAVVDEAATNRPRSSRRPLVKFQGLGDRVPLRSLSDGAIRMYGVALALASSRNGFLLLDEAENGIHHSRQADFWKMVLESARQNNIQVIATTHSRDTVVGFAKAVKDLEEPEAVHIRLERTGTEMRAVTYSRDNLMAAAKYNIETR